jgi:hypothetical protein
VPTWIVDGDHDEALKRENTDHMAALIPGSGELILHEVSHFAFLQDPVMFNQSLLPERLRGAHVSHRDNYVKSPCTRPMGLGLSGDLVGRRKDGTEFPVDVSLSSFESADGRLAMAFITEIFWDPI